MYHLRQNGEETQSMSTTYDTLRPPRRGGGTGRPRLWQVVVLFGLLLVTALAGQMTFVRVWGTGQQPAPTYSVSLVERQTVTSIVSASGTVSATRQVKLTFAGTGRLSRLSVKQGDTVQEGQELAQLDTTALQIRYDTTQSQLQAARARLQGLLAGPTASDISAQQQAISSAETGITRARNDLNNLLNGITPEDVAAVSATLDRAKAVLDLAQSNYEKLARGDDLTLRPEYSALQAAKNEYQSALTTLNNRTTPNPVDVTSARAALSSAQAAVESSQTRLTQLLTVNPADVNAAQAAISSAQSQIDSARARYQALVIGASMVDRQAAQLAVDAAQAQLDAAYARRGSTAGSESDSAGSDAAIAQARAGLEQAHANLRKLQGQTGGPELIAAEQAIRAAESGLSTAQNNLAKLLTPSPTDVAAAQQQLTAAQTQVTTAQGNLDKLLRPNQDDIAQARAALDRAQSSLDTAQINWDRLASRSDIDQRPETTALNAARAEYQSALASYTLKTAGPRAGDVQSAQATINSAVATLAAAQARLAQLLAGTPASDIAQQREAVTQLELALKSSRNDLDNTVLRAPFTGTITAVGVNENDQIGATSAVATLLDPTLIRVDATLDESNVARVRAGQTALVSFDALGGRPIPASVAVVTPAGVTTQGVTTFPVSVVFSGQGAAIPAGLTATVRIVTERKDSVVVAPSRALKRQGRETSVDVVLPDGKLESRTVQTGLVGDAGVTEIVTGLTVGDVVAIPAVARAGGQTAGAGGAFGAGGLPGLGAPAAPAQQRR